MRWKTDQAPGLNIPTGADVSVPSPEASPLLAKTGVVDTGLRGAVGKGRWVELTGGCRLRLGFSTCVSRGEGVGQDRTSLREME